MHVEHALISTHMYLYTDLFYSYCSYLFYTYNLQVFGKEVYSLCTLVGIGSKMRLDANKPGGKLLLLTVPRQSSPFLTFILCMSYVYF